MKLEDLVIRYEEPGSTKKAIGKIVAVTVRWDTEEDEIEYGEEFFNEHFKIIPKPQERP